MQYKLNLINFNYKEIAVEIFVPDALQVQRQYYEAKNEITFPYWSKIWPAAFAMAEFLINNPNYIINKKVMELAAGLALPSLVAARFASEVSFSDHSADSVAIAILSAKQNNLKTISGKVLDWKQLQHPLNAEVVLMSDINYEPKHFDALHNVIGDLLNKNITVILSTPQRLPAKPFIENLLHYAVQKENIDAIENDVVNTITVLVLKENKLSGI